MFRYKRARLHCSVYCKGLARLNYSLRKYTMLVTIAVVLIALWLLGLVTAYTVGGFIHVLLVIAVIMVLVRVIRGENPFA